MLRVVEHLVVGQRVEGSSPSRASNDGSIPSRWQRFGKKRWVRFPLIYSDWVGYSSDNRGRVCSSAW